MLSIEILSPLKATDADLARRQGRYAAQALSTDIAVTVHNLQGGPAALNSAEDLQCSADAICAYGVSLSTEQKKAILIDCVFDTATVELRDHLRVPVFGPTEVTLPLINHVADSFSIIARTRTQCDLLAELIAGYGYGARINSLRALDISYGEAKQPAIFNRVINERIRSVRTDGAGAVFLGSTTMAVNGEMRKAADGIPLFMPGMVGLSVIELLWRNGVLLQKQTAQVE